MTRRRARFVTALGAALALLAGVTLAVFQISRAHCFSLVGDAICRVETNEPLVALTFDDGPTPEGVALATAALREAGVHATFFLIGGAVEGNAPLVRQLLSEGHEVGNHSYSHERMIFHTSDWYEQEVMRTDVLLRAAGAAPTLFRPPYGKKLIGLPQTLARHNYRMIMWDVEDPPGATDARAYADGILREARPGSIILMHLMYRTNTVAREALPLVLRGLRERGLRVVTVGELLRHRG